MDKRKVDDKEEFEKIMDIVENSVVVDDSYDDSLGKDLQEIANQLTNDKNTFRFSNYSKSILFEDALLGAIASRPNYKKDVKSRYSFLEAFRYNFHVGRGALKSGQVERFKDLASSLLAFRGALEWRNAGVSSEGFTEQKKSSIVDRFKKR